METIYFQLQCCGMNSFTDWHQYANFPVNTAPDSCCKELASQTKCDSNSINSMYNEGCMNKLQSAIESNAMILGGVGIGIALIQVSKIELHIILKEYLRFKLLSKETS